MRGRVVDCGRVLCVPVCLMCVRLYTCVCVCVWVNGERERGHGKAKRETRSEGGSVQYV